jgi:peptidyl-prolyl cis-trans isomerase D
MFDLFRSRDKAVRYLLGALLGLVALSLVITLIPGYGTPSAPREQVVAEIGGEALTVREVQSTLQSALRGRQIPPEMIQFYVPQFVDQMITERAVAYQAERMGFKVTDEELANAIRSMIAQYFPGEVKQEEYARFLSQQGLSIQEFERNVRQNLLRLRLENIALEGAVVTPDEVEKEYRRKNDKVKLEYIKWTPPADLRSQVTLTDADLRGFYEAQKAQFTTPEKRSFHLLIADEAKIGAAFQIPEAELRAAYQSQLDKFRTGDRVKVRHILIKTTEKNAAEQAAAEKKAQELLKQIRGGADFAELAKKNSDDPGSAVNGGDLGWVTRGQTVPNFEKAAFALAPKQISDVVKTEYGFHIIQGQEKEAARVKPFEEVKDQLATELKREGVFNKMQQSIEQARAELAKSPQAAPQIAGKYGLSHYFVENHGANESVPELGTSNELEGAVSSVRANEVTPVTQVAPNKLAVAAVTQVVPAHPAEFKEVEPQVRERLTALRVQQMADQRRQQVMQTLKNVTGDLNAAAKQVGAQVKTTDFFTVEGTVEGLGGGAQFTDAFNKPIGAVVGPIPAGDQVILARVLEKQPADMGKLATERDALVLGLKRRRAAERKELFEDGLLTQLVKEGKVKKYQETINRVVQSFRG